VAVATSPERLRDEIVRLAHGELDSVSLRQKIASRLIQAVPAESYGFGTLDPATVLLTGSVRENVTDDTVRQLARNEYAEADYNKFVELATRRVPVGRLSAETRGDLRRSHRYRSIFRPLGWGDELRAVFLSGGLPWGFICLHRDCTRPAFTSAEARYLARVVSHVGAGLRKSVLFDAVRCRAGHERGAGLIEVTEGLEIAASNAAAEAWLAELAGGRTSAHGPLPHAVYAVVAQLEATEHHPESAAPPRLRVCSRSGRWLVLHASRLHRRDATASIGVIIEPAEPLDLAPLIVQAYGLSARERQICLLVMRGRSTAEIAAELHISPHTTYDHLKAIFDKTGVRSRRELVSRIFVEHFSNDDFRERPLTQSASPGAGSLPGRIHRGR
jgi:DNA-binding CsgD family transcriptional regulator